MSVAGLPARRSTDWRFDAAAALMVVGFIVGGSIGLGTRPLVTEDEPWIAEPGYVFWQRGTFSSELFRGFFGSERAFHDFLPLYSLIVGASLHIGGVGLAQARAVSLLMAGVVLGCTYLVARRLRSPPEGLLALTVLAIWPVAAGPPRDATGIPLLDLGRVARYDMGVAAFGMLALTLALPVLLTRSDEGLGRRDARARTLVAGALCGCAVLSHHYGGAWLIVLGAGLALVHGRRARPYALNLVAGFGLALAPWAVWTALTWEDAVAQSVAFRHGRHLIGTSATPLLSSVLSEWQRLAPVARGALDGQLAPWIWTGLVTAGLVTMAVRRGARAHAIVLVALGGHVLLFALLLPVKDVRYVAPLWPLFAIVTARGASAMWALRHGPNLSGSDTLRLPRVAGLSSLVGFGQVCRWLVVRMALVLALAACTLEGVRAFARMTMRVRATTPYATLTERLAARIPEGSRILALQHYWFGLAERGFDYRSMLAPVGLSDPRAGGRWADFPVHADAVDANVVIVDPVLAAFMRRSSARSEPTHPLVAPMAEWVESRWAVAAVVDDPTYGRFEIRVRKP